MRKYSLLHILIISSLFLIPLVAQAGEEKTHTCTDSITGMEFVLVKRGCFDMGDNARDVDNDGVGDVDSDEMPVHEVCVDDFYIGKYEVTQGQWEEVMGSNPSNFMSGNNYPVERVSWNDVQSFIIKLNNKTDRNYRLPTEAEWEYAARSGVWIGMMNVIMKIALVTIQKVHLAVPAMFIVVVAGSTNRGTREHLIATATPLVTRAAI